ncbi:MAG: DUF502 domain-containing protein [Candidatus Hydrogenedentes bacterium]|nr:DUF502 domain-containing protein [Candidatus Hydrogenedentota bacterium]
MWRYLRVLRFYLVTGLLVWIPLIVTLWLTWWLFKNVGLGLENLIKSAYLAFNDLGKSDTYTWLGFLPEIKYIPGFGFLIAVALFLTTGFLTRNLVGRRVIRAGERIMDRIPLVSKIYRAVQQIRDVFVSRDGTVFQQVCLVEYPRKGVYAVAFITSTDQGVVHDVVDKQLYSVFVPTTPNPTSGFLLYLNPEEITILDISVEEAMKLIISAGAYLPGSQAVDQLKELAKTEPLASVSATEE